MPVPYWLCLFLVCVYCHDTRSVDSTLHNGLNAGKEIAEEINGGDFLSTIGKAAKTAVPFLSAIATVSKLIFGQGNSQPPELQFLKQLSETVNARFDQVDIQFSDIKRLINWSSVRVSYNDIESRILAVSNAYDNLYRVPGSALNAQRQIFITSYESGYQDSGIKLYKGFMNDDNVFGQGLLGPAMQYTENDRGKMRTFMLGILKLLIMAAKLELEYYGIKGYNTVVPFYVQQWQVRLERINPKMIAADFEVASKYHSQLVVDIESFAAMNSSLSNEDYSRVLYQKLSAKYFWRDWLVIISSPNSHYRAYYHMCDGYAKQIHNKDVAVASVDNQKTPISKGQVDILVNSLNQTCKNTATEIHVCGDHFTEHDGAKEMYAWITPTIRANCSSPYASVGTSDRQLYFTPHLKRLIGICGKRDQPLESIAKMQPLRNRRYTALTKRLYISHLLCGEVYFFG